MKDNKNPRFRSIGAKIFISMLALILLMLTFLWLSQTVFLSTFYKLSKKFDTYRASTSIVENIDNDKISTLTKELSTSHDACIKVINASKGYTAVDGCDAHADNFNCILHKIQTTPEVCSNWLQKASDHDGFYSEIFSRDKFEEYQFNPDDFNGKVPTEDTLDECIISVAATTNENGESILIIFNSSIEPVRATVRTIRSQLVVITIFMIFAAFIVAFFVARHMSSPIVDINRRAKELAKGILPVVAAPAATHIMLPSAIPQSKNLSGNFFLNVIVFVDFARSASKTIISVLSPNSARALPYASRVAIF